MLCEQPAAREVGVRAKAPFEDVLAKSGIDLPMHGLAAMAFEQEVKGQPCSVRHARPRVSIRRGRSEWYSHARSLSNKMERASYSRGVARIASS
jgi:hypothetical protein